VDMAEGAELLAASDDVATISAIVGLMGEEDLEQGLALARLAGELQAASKVVDLMVMPVLTGFLETRSAQLQDLAVDNILQSAGNRALARVLAAKGLEIEEMGIEEMAEGLTRIAASEAMEERSEDLAVAGVVLVAKGVEEVVAAKETADLAKEIAKDGVVEVAEGSAEFGAATAKNEEENK